MISGNQSSSNVARPLPAEPFRATAADYLRALTEISHGVQETAQLSAALEDALSRAAVLVPGTVIAWRRSHPDTAETRFFVSCGEFADLRDTAPLHRMLDRLVAQQPPADQATTVGGCAHFSVQPALLMEATGVQASSVDAFVSPVGHACIDLLLVVCLTGRTLSSCSIEFLRSLLVCAQSAADSLFNQGRSERVHHQVIQAKQEWETVVDALPQLVCLLDHRGRVVRANRAVEGLHLGDVQKTLGQQFFALLWQLGVSPQVLVEKLEECGLFASPAVGSEQGLPNFDSVWASLKVPVSGESVSISGLISASGNVHDLTIQKVAVVHDRDGKAGCCIAVLEDVTERTAAVRLIEDFNQELEHKVAEKTSELSLANAKLRIETEAHGRDQEALRLSEHRYQSFVDNTLTGIYLAKEGRITYHNKRFAELLGCAENDLLGVRLEDCLSGDCFSPDLLAEASWQGRGRECLVRTRDRRKVWLYVTQAPFSSGQRQILVGNVLDVTASKESQIKLLASNRRAAILSERLIVAQEQERRRIARELHDDIGQRLTSVKLVLENIGDQCALAKDSPIGRQIQGLRAALRDTVEETRRVAMALRPSILDDLGIDATLSWLLREIPRMLPEAQVQYRFEVDETRVGPRFKTEIFRIAQEAVNNICKHSGATVIELSVTPVGEEILLRIRDDGAGIVQDGEQDLCGFGMSSMRERAELIGGDLFVVSRDGSGVSIIGRWLAGDVGADR